ncbi:hypothetical protein SD77_0543 [Bacillus badius]|uniref:Mobile element protein n=1 Tax=Bacillus badius TaxID=1455 RepID=A0ABR5B119_BACBA|nr:hypothetical protein SD78_3875 [Bacillus badius]KIL80695.1 hypothetical protein SD77_0543 [Bacillus badius]
MSGEEKKGLVRIGEDLFTGRKKKRKLSKYPFIKIGQYGYLYY